MKIPKKVRQNYELYERCIQVFSKVGKQIPEFEFDVNGRTALECFSLYDSQGKFLPCRELDRLNAILWAKSSLNWHIENWAAGFAELTLFPNEINTAFPWLPEWVWEAIWNQVRKRLLKGKEQ